MSVHGLTNPLVQRIDRGTPSTAVIGKRRQKWFPGSRDPVNQLGEKGLGDKVKKSRCGDCVVGGEIKQVETGRKVELLGLERTHGQIIKAT